MKDKQLKKVLILSGHHFITAPRKVDLHFLAEAYLDMGIKVDFVTLRLSQVSRWLDDGRWKFSRTCQVNRWHRLSPLLEEFIWVNVVHPFNLRVDFLNRLTAPLFRHYGKLLPRAVKERLGGYSHIFVESGLPPLLFRELKALAPQARFIYHGADRLATIGVHPVISEEMEATASLYDLVRVMAPALADDFPPQTRVVYLPHGISKELFDASPPSPYTTSKNAVSVGDMLFDARTIGALASAFPDWTFHLFGKKAKLTDAPDNVVTHGEVPFTEIVPYILHADVGLAPYLPGKDADYLSQSSLKMIQYTYARLPIVAPAFAASGRAHVCAYTPGDEASLLRAFRKAVVFDRRRVSAQKVKTWKETALAILDETGEQGRRAKARVSVVIAAYNAEQTLEASIRSCVAQTGVTVEVVVVNDASTDGTKALLEALKKKLGTMLTVVHCRKNGGPSVARNLGFAKARGDWIAVLDADDTMAPERLQTMVESIERERADICFDNLMIVPAGEARESTAARVHVPHGLVARLRQPWTPGFYARFNEPYSGRTLLGFLKPLFRRTFLEKQPLLYRNELHNSEDYILILEALIAGAKVCYVHKAMYYYQVYPKSLSGKFDASAHAALMARERQILREARARLAEEDVRAIAHHLEALRIAEETSRIFAAIRTRRPEAVWRALWAGRRHVHLHLHRVGTSVYRKVTGQISRGH